MRRFHTGLDHHGHRHRRMRNQAEMRRTVELRRLYPVLVLVCHTSQARWRNGMQRRRFTILSEQVRGDRRCFLMTLRRPPLVPPIRPF